MIDKALNALFDASKPRRVVILDAETRSPIDVHDGGARRHITHPLAGAWSVAFAVDDQPVQIWWRGEPVPPEIIEAAADPATVFVAHNGGFDRRVWIHILGPQHSWPEAPPLDRWRCSVAMCRALALPAGLGKVTTALGLPYQKADNVIVGRMARPRPPRPGEDPAKIYWNDNPEDHEKLRDYNKRDVEATRALFNWLLPLIPVEQQIWQLDQISNSRGVYIDGTLPEKAIALATATYNAAQVEIRAVTNREIETTGQIDKVKAWLAARGCEMESLEADLVSQALRRTDLRSDVRRVLELRQDAAPTSANKYRAVQNWRCDDGRVYDALQYHAAGTGRWSAFGVQWQNFKKESENTAAKLAAVMTGDLDAVRQLGRPLDILGDISRALICAPPGYRLLIGDFSGIESRVTAWVAGQEDKLDLWAKFDRSRDPKDDPYFILGCELGFPPEIARKYGKVADLAFGYGGKVPAFRNFAPPDDTTTDAQILAYQQAWCARHPLIARFWGEITKAAIAAVRGAPQTCDRVSLQCRELHGVPFLFVTLPSGRSISYPFVKLIRNDRGFLAVSFMDNALNTGGWTEYRKGYGAWGGTFTENVVSGIARDLLADAMVRLEAAGYPIVLHVHDELVVELPNGIGSSEEFKYLIERLPPWASR